AHRDLVRRRLPVVLRREAPAGDRARRVRPPRRGRGGLPLLRARPRRTAARPRAEHRGAGPQVPPHRRRDPRHAAAADRPRGAGGAGAPALRHRAHQHRRRAPGAAPRARDRWCGTPGAAQGGPARGVLRARPGHRRPRRAACGRGLGGAGRRARGGGARLRRVRRRGRRRRRAGPGVRRHRRALLRPRPAVRHLGRAARRGLRLGARAGVGRLAAAAQRRRRGRRGCLRPGRVRLL
ncbi:MAG: protein dithiol-disulfide isomerase, partial [uncultured Nocardioides sp.]